MSEDAVGGEAGRGSAPEVELSWRDYLWSLWVGTRYKLKWRYWRCRWFGHDWVPQEGGWRYCFRCRWSSVPAGAPREAIRAMLTDDPEPADHRP